MESNAKAPIDTKTDPFMWAGLRSACKVILPWFREFFFLEVISFYQGLLFIQWTNYSINPINLTPWATLIKEKIIWELDSQSP